MLLDRGGAYARHPESVPLYPRVGPLSYSQGEL
jgi:hypothetical protein